jgi:Do/DeqQ family serine protease
MRVTHNAAAVALISSANLLWSCNGSGPTSKAQMAGPDQPTATTAQPAAPVTARTESPDVAKNLSKAFAATAKAVRPSVVRIDVQSRRSPVAQLPGHPFAQGHAPEGLPPPFRRFFDFGGMPPSPESPGPVSGTGSGVIFDAAGNIVTNSHVVDGSAEIKVTLADGEEVPAKLIGRDKRTDVAVIRLDRLPKNPVAARLGDSNRIEVGEWVLALGSPLGLEQTVTAGIVSGKGHVGRLVQMSGDRVREYIQTDAKINPGNSGGPLVNLDGEVLGINTLIRTGAGGAYGFAVPVNEVRRVAQALITDGRIRYPFLGVSVRDLGSLETPTKELLGRSAPAEGAYVADVTAGSPAAVAGIKQGDVITKLDGEAVKASADVVDYVSSRTIGANVAVTLLRDGTTRQLGATLAPAPGDDEQRAAPALGLTLQTLTPALAESLRVPPGARGVAITDVTEGSPGARAGLQPGDVILDVDRRPVSSVDEATGLLGAGGPGHLLRVYGRSGIRFVMVATNG